MNLYDFMNELDRFTIEYQDFDFREMEVKVSKIPELDIEGIYISFRNKNGKLISKLIYL